MSRRGDANSARLPAQREAGQASAATQNEAALMATPDAAALAARTEARPAALRKQFLRDLPEPLATDDVDGLNPQGIERPEALFDQAKQRTPAEPGKAEERRKEHD